MRGYNHVKESIAEEMEVVLSEVII